MLRENPLDAVMARMGPEDRMLFGKFAAPCVSTLVAEKRATEEYRLEFVRKISEGGVPGEDDLRRFPLAIAELSRTAKRMKDETMADSIRVYFLLDHNLLLDKQAAAEHMFGIVRDGKSDCKAYLGIVGRTGAGAANVETEFGRKTYSTAFVNGVKEGDMVIAHFGYVVEKLTAEGRARILEKVEAERKKLMSQ
ncbi:Uncharacterised protein [uncultured archaeon]|nr:Uncharacterised protein [uncultured archaeon]